MLRSAHPLVCASRSTRPPHPSRRLRKRRKPPQDEAGVRYILEATAMLMRSLLVAMTAALLATPASAQFYKDKTLTLLVNYAAGGNADTEARVYQRHLAKHIPGRPNVIIRNVAGACGATPMNHLGLGIGL